MTSASLIKASTRSLFASGFLAGIVLALNSECRTRYLSMAGLNATGWNPCVQTFAALLINFVLWGTCVCWPSPLPSVPTGL